MALSGAHDSVTSMSLLAGQSVISSPTTSFLPLSTAWPLSVECSSLFVSHSSSSGLYAFDPSYPTQSSIQCLPPAATAWWDQVATPGATPTILGGSALVCPQAYTTAASSVINSFTTLVGCCPSNYDFVSWDLSTAQPVPTQCSSALPAEGGAETYIQQNVGADSWSTATTIVHEIWAFHINGYLLSSPTPGSTPSITAVPINESPTTTTGSPASSTSDMGSASTTATAPLDGGTPYGRATIIGLSLGLGFITICSIVAGIRSYAKKKARQRQERPPNQEVMIGALYPELKDDPPAMVTPENFEMSPRRMRRELYPAQFGEISRFTP